VQAAQVRRLKAAMGSAASGTMSFSTSKGGRAPYRVTNATPAKIMAFSGLT